MRNAFVTRRVSLSPSQTLKMPRLSAEGFVRDGLVVSTRVIISHFRYSIYYRTQTRERLISVTIFLLDSLFDESQVARRP
jgi:hypothetical protein